MLQTQRAKPKKKAAQYGTAKASGTAAKAESDPWDDCVGLVYEMSSPSSESASVASSDFSLPSVTGRTQKPAAYGKQRKTAGPKKNSAVSSHPAGTSKQTLSWKTSEDWMFGGGGQKENKAPCNGKSHKSKRPQKSKAEFSNFFADDDITDFTHVKGAAEEAVSHHSSKLQSTKSHARSSVPCSAMVGKPLTVPVPESPDVVLPVVADRSESSSAQLTTAGGVAGRSSPSGVLVIPDTPEKGESQGSNGASDAGQVASSNAYIPDTPMLHGCAQFLATSTPCEFSGSISISLSGLPKIDLGGNKPPLGSNSPTSSPGQPQADQSGQQASQCIIVDGEDALLQRGDCVPDTAVRRCTRATARRNGAPRLDRRKSFALRKSRCVIPSSLATPILVADDSINELQHSLSHLAIFANPAEKTSLVTAADDTKSSLNSAASPSVASCSGPACSPSKSADDDDHCCLVAMRHEAANLLGEFTICDWVFALPPTPTVTPKQQLLNVCNQVNPIPFSKVFTKSIMRHCRKVGEGVYGEVFVANNDCGQPVALKVIPIEGSVAVNDEPQKTFAEMIPETVISSVLSGLGEDGTGDGSQHFTPNFIKLHRVACCQGSYPKALLKLWDQWGRDNDTENDRPDFYTSDQLFIIFEFANGGRDLEHSTLSDFKQAVSVFQQVTLALATAEQAYKFEHRDLHWGNILLRQCSPDDMVSSRVNGAEFQVESNGIHISLIDFTLSRMTRDNSTIFCDLAADPTLFTGEGDFQFEVYRLMRDELSNDWSRTQPSTNILWLRYLLDKLLRSVTYVSSTSQRGSRSSLSRLEQRLKKKVYSSAWELLQNDALFSQALVAGR